MKGTLQATAICQAAAGVYVCQVFGTRVLRLPVYAPKICAALIECRRAPHSSATKRAASVLPHPGGPCSSRPRGQSTPRSAPSSACCRGHPVASQGRLHSMCLHRTSSVLECSHASHTVYMHSCQSSRVLQLQEGGVTEPCMHDLAEQAGHGAHTYQLPEGCQHGSHACHCTICVGSTCKCRTSGC